MYSFIRSSPVHYLTHSWKPGAQFHPVIASPLSDTQLEAWCTVSSGHRQSSIWHTVGSLLHSSIRSSPVQYLTHSWKPGAQFHIRSSPVQYLTHSWKPGAQFHPVLASPVSDTQLEAWCTVRVHFLTIYWKPGAQFHPVLVSIIWQSIESLVHSSIQSLGPLSDNLLNAWCTVPSGPRIHYLTIYWKSGAHFHSVLGSIIWQNCWKPDAQFHPVLVFINWQNCWKPDAQFHPSPLSGPLSDKTVESLLHISIRSSGPLSDNLLKDWCTVPSGPRVHYLTIYWSPGAQFHPILGSIIWQSI